MGGGNSGIRSIIYYVNWAIYGRNHQPQDLAPSASQFTHILYSFANVRPETGEVYLTDTWSDTDKHYPTDSWNDVGTNVYGCVKQLFLLKKRNRNLKVLLSIGGWTYSSNFAPAARTKTGREEFARSAVKLVEDLGFDGIDVDWEYPRDDREAHDYVELLGECRRALDHAAACRGNGEATKFYLSAAVPAGPTNFNKLQIPGMDRSLDFWNLMAYDYAGSWDQTCGHQSNVYPSRHHPACTPFNTDAAVKHYLSHSVASHKLVLGMPLYGRAFENTVEPGAPYSGIGEGDWERGVRDYKSLPLPGAQEFCDHHTIASWSYNPDSRTMISYDTPQVVEIKADYVKQTGLGGGMWWESSGDKPRGSGSLVETFLNKSGGESALEWAPNCLEYPNSKFENLRNGFPGE